MKEDVFNQNAQRVIDLFGIDRETLFSRSKKQEPAGARHLLYYLCYIRPMSITYIQKYMAINGHEVHLTSISRGIKSIQNKVDEDRDYQKIIREINQSVSI